MSLPLEPQHIDEFLADIQHNVNQLKLEKNFELQELKDNFNLTFFARALELDVSHARAFQKQYFVTQLRSFLYANIMHANWFVMEGLESGTRAVALPQYDPKEDGFKAQPNPKFDTNEGAAKYRALQSASEVLLRNIMDLSVSRFQAYKVHLWREGREWYIQYIPAVAF